MIIEINGSKREFDHNSCSIKDLIEDLSIDRETIVAELNGVIIASDKFDDTILKSDDKLELIRFVGGG